MLPRSDIELQPDPWLIRCFQITYLTPSLSLFLRAQAAMRSPRALWAAVGIVPPVLIMKSQARPSGCSPLEPDRKHPTSYGSEKFFWTWAFMIRVRAVMLSEPVGSSGAQLPSEFLPGPNG